MTTYCNLSLKIRGIWNFFLKRKKKSGEFGPFFLHGKSFGWVEIVFFRSKFVEISPIRMNTGRYITKRVVGLKPKNGLPFKDRIVDFESKKGRIVDFESKKDRIVDFESKKDRIVDFESTKDRIVDFESIKGNGKLVTLDYQSQVSILGPVGYGPTTLPLRHSDVATLSSDSLF